MSILISESERDIVERDRAVGELLVLRAENVKLKEQLSRQQEASSHQHRQLYEEMEQKRRDIERRISTLEAELSFSKAAANMKAIRKTAKNNNNDAVARKSKTETDAPKLLPNCLSLIMQRSMRSDEDGCPDKPDLF